MTAAEEVFNASRVTASDASDAIASLDDALASVLDTDVPPSADLVSTFESFTEAALDFAGSALESLGASVGEDVLELTDRLALGVHALLPSAPAVNGNVGYSTISFSSPIITLAVVSAPPPPLPVEDGGSDGGPSALSSLVVVPLQLDPEVKELEAVVSLNLSDISCGIMVALLGVDPHGEAATGLSLANDLFSGVIHVRTVCDAELEDDANADADGSDAPSVSQQSLGQSLDEARPVERGPTPSTVYSFNASLPPRGGGNCSSSRFRSLILGGDEGDAACPGGVCCGGTCSCEPGYYGEHCEVHVDCGHVPLNGRQYDNTTCSLVASQGSSWMNCSCSVLEGDFALRYSELRHRWLPTSNVHLSTENLMILRQKLRTKPLVWLAFFGMLALWLLLAARALHQDCRHAYVHETPHWMQVPESYR